MTTQEMDQVLERAIALLPSYVPQEHRQPIPGGGNVLATATALLVTARAVVAAITELEAKTRKVTG